MIAKNIPVELIDIPPEYARVESLVEDDALRKSIEKGGIHQPIVVLADGKRFTTIKGTRRVEIARMIGLASVPAVIDEVPAGEDPVAYRNRVRFVIDEHRQDLLPSQRAELIGKLKELFGMNYTQIAAYLGIDPGSVTNWIAVKLYIPEVAKAVDANAATEGREGITMHAARVFDGMTEEGQRAIWRAHRKDLASVTGGEMHKRIRKAYPPDKYAQFYREPEKMKERLSRKSAPRKTNPRTAVSRAQRERLFSSFEVKEIELRERKKEQVHKTRLIDLAVRPIAAIIRNEEIWNALDEDERMDFERFAEVYV